MRKAVIFFIFALLILQAPLAVAQTNYRYTGQELDPSTGIYDYGARSYQPETGRFMQLDPVSKNLADPQVLNEMTGQNLQNLLKNPQALNEYSYTQNNPVRYIDPEGEFNFETNQVEVGDTLSGVFGNNWVDVAKYNNLENPNLIYIGQHLDIPEFAQKNLWQNLADIATAFVPGVSDIRDGIENITKTDLITGRSLTPGEEALTFGGYATPLVLSAKHLRALNTAGKAFDDLIDLTFTGHGINQAITRGVKPKDIKDAMLYPVKIIQKIDDLGRTSFRYFGQSAMVAINKTKEVVTTWRLHK